MKIVADENITYAAEAFSGLGELLLVPGREIETAMIDDAEVLLVRSVTQVNESLLSGTTVQFVGAATSGYDHVDMDYLRSAGIVFAYAPGSNANSVAEYVTAALLELERMGRLNLRDATLGIVGLGHVGRQVLVKGRALGLSCVVNDPPLARATCEPLFRPLDEIFDCDIVTFHVPLTETGPDPTYHLVDESFLARLKPGAILVNTARGGVVQEEALKRAIRRGGIGATVLDVWEDEPRIDADLLKTVDIGTAHIAGYSFDGKAKGTKMLYDAVCRFLGHSPSWDYSALPADLDSPTIEVDPNEPDALSRAVSAVYDIMADHSALLSIAEEPEEARAQRFDKLRKQYRRRREFHTREIKLRVAAPDVRDTLEKLGFRITCEQNG